MGPPHGAAEEAGGVVKVDLTGRVSVPHDVQPVHIGLRGNHQSGRDTDGAVCVTGGPGRQKNQYPP